MNGFIPILNKGELQINHVNIIDSNLYEDKILLDDSELSDIRSRYYLCTLLV
jgi:hypothetical protein